MELKRHYKRDGFDPEAHAALRGELADLQAALRTAQKKRDPAAVKSAAAAVKAKKAELDAATPPVIGVAMKSTGATSGQKFSPAMVRQGIKEGWLREEDGKLILTSHDEVIPDPEKPHMRTLENPTEHHYTIVREPLSERDRVCCYCGESVEGGKDEIDQGPDMDKSTVGREHVTLMHPDEDAKVQDAMAAATGRERWQKVFALGKSFGMDDENAKELANNPQGIKASEYYLCELTTSPVAPARLQKGAPSNG